MMFRALIIAGAALVAAPLVAQTTTQCSTSVGITTCNTTGQPNSANRSTIDPNAFQRGYNRGRNAVDSVTESFSQAERDRAQRQLDMAMIRQSQQAQAQTDQAAAQQSAAKTLGIRAGQLVASGDCAGAQTLALDAGDFELANAVKSYCAK